MTLERVLEKLILDRDNALQTVLEYATEKKYGIMQIFVESAEMYNTVIPIIKGMIEKEKE